MKGSSHTILKFQFDVNTSTDFLTRGVVLPSAMWCYDSELNKVVQESEVELKLWN